MFTRFNRLARIAADAAENMGYDCAWLGLTNSNPFPISTINYNRYEWGFNEALDDIEEWKDATYPSDEYDEYYILH